MSFKDQLAADAADVFLNTNEFAEKITYVPKAGDQKIVDALIVRDRPDPGEVGVGRILRTQCEVYIANNTTTGIDSVNKGEDAVEFPDVPGGSNILWVIIDFLGMDHIGIWHLLVEK